LRTGNQCDNEKEREEISSRVRESNHHRCEHGKYNDKNDGGLNGKLERVHASRGCRMYDVTPSR
jgi:hypothetical protein